MTASGAELERPSTGEPLRPLLAVAGVAGVMWAVEVVDLVPGTGFDRWGIRPRSTEGLAGVVTAPFLHAGFGHLLANTIPFVVLGAAIATGGLRRFAAVMAIVALTSGLGTWLFGAPGTVHVGASGLVFGALTYLVTRGFFAGRVLWIAGGLVVLAVYGGLLWGLLPRPGISFTGHLFGAVGGILAAWLVHGRAGDESGAG